MKTATLTLAMALLATSCGGTADPEPPVPAAEAGAARMAEADATADTSDRPMRMHRREGAGAGEGMRMHQGRGQGMHQGRGQGMRQGRGGGMQGEGGGMRGEGGRMGRAVERPATPAELVEGERLFDAICAQCHTVDPPPNLAPPISHVARHLGQAFDTETAFRDHVRTFVPEPSEEASVMPAHAVERFGLMPPLPLPEPLLDQISGYLWWLYQVDTEASSR